MPEYRLKKMVFASLCAALTAAGAFVAIPVGPVPIVLQNFFVLLTGLLLGSRWGTASMGVYLAAGVLGLPVFAGGTGGIGRFMGPTGGYLIGYLPAVFLVGRISEMAHARLAGDVFAGICGSAVVYAFGIVWLSFITRMNLEKALAIGFFPVIIGDAIKIVAAAAAARVLRPVVGTSSESISSNTSSSFP